MVTYRKTWTLMGHSNGEGIAGSSPMYNAAPHLQTFGGASQATTQANAEKRIHKNLKMFMSALPWPAAAGTPPSTAIGTGAWKDMTLDVALSPGHPHPYASPYQYPSGRSVPVTPDFYRADQNGFLGYLVASGGGGFCGVELPLAHGLAQIWGEPAYGVKLSIPATYLMRRDAGLSYPWYGWWSPDSNFDWEPSTGRLYASMIAKMTGAAAALPAGEKMDVRCSVFWQGDNDATLADANPDRITRFKQTYKALMHKWRTDLVTNEWTRLPYEQIPIIGMGVYESTYGTGGSGAAMNAILREIAEEDAYFHYQSTNGYESLLTAGYNDASHISHNGYIDAADDIVAALESMDVAPLDAMDKGDLLTVSEVRERVRLVYNNNRARTGATDDDTLLEHINASLLHIHSKMGDQAYWLRKRVTLTFSSNIGDVETMQSRVHRVLRIENPNDPTKILRFQMIGFAEGGKLQIVMQDRGAGDYVVHYIENPKELTADDQVVPLPRIALEWLVNEVARRLARTSPNVVFQRQLEVDCMKCHSDVARYAAAMQRAKQDRLYGQRSLRGRLGSHRRFPWLN